MTKTRILIIEDDGQSRPYIADGVRHTLGGSPFIVAPDSFRNCELVLGPEEAYDLILLDVDLRHWEKHTWVCLMDAIQATPCPRLGCISSSTDAMDAMRLAFPGKKVRYVGKNRTIADSLIFGTNLSNLMED